MDNIFLFEGDRKMQEIFELNQSCYDSKHYYNNLPIEGVPCRPKKILIIDDDQDFRLTLGEILVDEGFTVTTAKNGEVALINLMHQTSLPDLILVDVLMPVMGGMEFRQEQMKYPEISHIPVIFMTGQGDIASERGLLKPFDVFEILEKINRVIS